MPLPGKAAMLLLFDIAQEAIAEHDEWHTHEHLPERLCIPGFVRGTRWRAVLGEPGYFVMYEVEELAVLTSKAYLERLNNPTPWTSKMMPFYRGMTRGLCAVKESFGVGLGGVGLLLRVKRGERLLDDILPGLPSRPGIGGAHVFEGAATPPMTKEQRIRGADARLDGALLVTGYSQDALESLMQTELAGAQLESAIYRLEYALTAREVGA
jgi:hypothetical protein